MSDILDLIAGSASFVGSTIFDAVVGLFSTIFLVFPDGGTLPQPVHDGAIYFGKLLGAWNFVFPVYDLVTILFISWSVTISYFVFRIIRYFFNYVRGVSTIVNVTNY